MAWDNNWRALSNIKSATNVQGDFTNGDVITANIFNATLNNIGYLKNTLDDFIGKLVTSWSSTPLNTNFPAEKLVKDSLDAINNTITTFRNSVNSSLTSINKKLYNTNNDGDYYSYVENPDSGFGFTIVSVNEFDGYKSETQFSSEDIQMRLYEGSDFHYVKTLSLAGLDNSISEINDDITNIRAKFNTLTGNDIQEVSANADSIISAGLYAVNFYVGTNPTKYTAMLNITNLSDDYSIILYCYSSTSTFGSPTETEVSYSGTSRKITISVRSAGSTTTTITSCNKIAKIS